MPSLNSVIYILLSDFVYPSSFRIATGPGFFTGRMSFLDPLADLFFLIGWLTHHNGWLADLNGYTVILTAG